MHDSQDMVSMTHYHLLVLSVPARLTNRAAPASGKLQASCHAELS